MIRSNSSQVLVRLFVFLRLFETTRKCGLILSLVISVFIAGAAPPGAVAQTTTPEFLFVGQTVPGPSGNIPAIATYAVNRTTGALTPIAAAPVQERGQGTGALAINRAATKLFGTTTNSAGQNAVEVFSVASDGSLAEVINSPFGIGHPEATPQLIAVSPNGNFLYVALQVLGTSSAPASTIVQVFAIASDGSLTLNNEFAFTAVEACDNMTPAPLTPVQFYLHPTQKWFYLLMASSFGPPCSGQPSEVQAFVINSDGTLTETGLDTLPLFATSAHALTGSPDGTILFLTTKQGTENEFLYSSGVDQATGGVGFSLAYAAPTFNPDLALTGLVVDSTSTYLYSTAGTFLMQDGTVTAIDSSTNPFLLGGNILASPTAPLIFGPAVTASSNVQFISALVNLDGSLTPAPGSPYSIPENEFAAVVLGEATPIPDKAVMWIRPDGPIDISGTQVGQVGSKNVAINNVGYGPLTITGITVTGDPSLSTTNTCTSPVAQTDSCLAVVNFTPPSAGTFTGTLTIETNLAPRTFAISATSVAPPPPAPDPILNGSNPILFPDTATGSSTPLTIQLQNGAQATGPLVVSSITIGGSNPGDFSQTDTCMSAPIPAGSSCTITATFSPQVVGGRAATLTVNGPGGALVGTTLSGTGATTVTKFSFTTVINGPGTVTQTPSGTSLPNNTTVTVKATPNANSSFVNWNGICVGIGNVPTCTIVLNANTIATANFATNVTLTTVVVGPGTIAQAPTGTSFAPGSVVVLTATPNSGAQFVGWTPSSACVPGTPAARCTVTLNSNTTVTATFIGPQVSLSTNVVGPGTIQQTPSGTSFAANTSITLTAVPSANAIFTSWAGACAGGTNPVCTFALTANTSVTATFTANPAVTVPQAPPPAPAGSPITAQINVTGFATPPALKASCTIPQGNCSISGTTLTVTTSARTSGVTHEIETPLLPPAAALGMRAVTGLLPLMLLGIFAVWLGTSNRRFRPGTPALATFIVIAGLSAVVGCGGGGGGTTPTGTPAGTYIITITATAGTQTAMTTVTVTVQ